MNLKQVFGMFLLIGGVGAFIYGLSIQDSVEYKFVSTFGGDTSRVVFLMIGGIIASIVGVLLLVFGRDKESGEERPVRTAGQPQQSQDVLDVLQFDDEKLTQITESSGFYRPEVSNNFRIPISRRRTNWVSFSLMRRNIRRFSMMKKVRWSSRSRGMAIRHCMMSV